MQQTNLTTKKNIQLPQGGVLEVDASPQFIEVVKKHFGLSVCSEVNDDHIRMYIWGAFKNAIDKSVGKKL
jgi:hypothetical protein